MPLKAVPSETIDTSLTPSPDPRPHLPALDGVRGLAVVLVVASHAMRIVPKTGQGLDQMAWETLAAGWIGVDLFFVLSGFLITGILLDAKRKPDGYFANFYARRILRIAPLYYGFLTIYFFVLPHIPLPVFRSMALPADVRPMLWFYLYNLWGAIHQGMHANVGVFWSLCIEEHFYLLWPAIVLMLERRQLMRVCLVVAGLSFVCRLAVVTWFPNDHAAYLMTPCRLDGLCGGAFAAAAMRDPRDARRLIGMSKWLVPAAGAFVLGMATGQRHFLDNIDFHGANLPGVDSTVVLCLGLTALAVLFTGAIVLTVNTGPGDLLQRAFRNRLLRTFGLYSYAIYVLHPLIVTLLRALLAGLNIDMPTSPMGALAARLGIVVTVLTFALGAGFLSYHLFEKHFLALKRYFPPARQPITVARAAPPPASDTPDPDRHDDPVPAGPG
jgi:peptidoglycan/LPS O-acetylase OafA/YrhL